MLKNNHYWNPLIDLHGCLYFCAVFVGKYLLCFCQSTI